VVVPLRAVDQSEFIGWCKTVGVEPGFSKEALDRAYLKKNLGLIRTGTPDEREQLRVAYEALVRHSPDQARGVRINASTGGPSVPVAPGSGRPPVPVYQLPTPDPSREIFNPLSFDSWVVNALALPLVALFAWLVNLSPLGFFLQGFHIWVHEFGHATVAWLVGKRALPLPIGWTNVAPEKSTFVYFGVLFLLGILMVAGWKERKIWPVLIALAVAPLQFYMTWRLPEYRADMWLSFAGVGGEFYLSALLMALFYVQFPEKFKWGACRYLFLFFGASSFLHIFLFWRQVKRGEESIPWGSMVQGEEDGGGDMNILRVDYHWSNHDIVGTYAHLGNVCLLVVLAVYLVFLLRVDRLTGRWLAERWRE